MATSRSILMTEDIIVHIDAQIDIPRIIDGELLGRVADVEADEGSASWSGLANAFAESLSAYVQSSARDSDDFRKAVVVTRDRTSLRPVWQPHQSALHDTR